MTVQNIPRWKTSHICNTIVVYFNMGTMSCIHILKQKINLCKLIPLTDVKSL